MIILYILLVIILAILLIAASKPNHFRYERQIVVNASPQAAFELVNNFQRWRSWSPWETMDPNLHRSYSGPDEGVGAAYDWQGNKNVGRGRMEITESVPAQRIRINLDFYEPFAAKNKAEFDFIAQGNQTKIVWAMSGPNLFIGKVMGVFFNMDKMVGKNFETGLANLKQQLE